MSTHPLIAVVPVATHMLILAIIILFSLPMLGEEVNMHGQQLMV